MMASYNSDISTGPLGQAGNELEHIQTDRLESMQAFIGDEGYALHETGRNSERFGRSPPSYVEAQRQTIPPEMPSLRPYQSPAMQSDSLQGMILACLQPFADRLASLEQSFNHLDSRYAAVEQRSTSTDTQVRDLKSKQSLVDTRISSIESNTVADLRKFKSELQTCKQDMYSSIKCVNSLKRIVDPDGTGARSRVSTEPSQRQFEALENRQQNVEEETNRLRQRIEVLESQTMSSETQTDDNPPPCVFSRGETNQPLDHPTSGVFRSDRNQPLDHPPNVFRGERDHLLSMDHRYTQPISGFGHQIRHGSMRENFGAPTFQGYPMPHDGPVYHSTPLPNFRYGSNVLTGRNGNPTANYVRPVNAMAAGNSTRNVRLNAPNEAMLPKLPNYNGQTPWSSFINTFEIHSESRNWCPEERLYYMRLCLTGKAMDYLVTMRNQGKCNSYEELVRIMSLRFDRRDDATTKRAQFNNLSQNLDETLEEWSERVMTHAYEAFIGVNPAFIEEEIVRRFCSGTVDKEAAQFVLNSGARTLEQAQSMMKRYRENSITIYGQKKIRKVKTRSESSDNASTSSEEGKSKETSAKKKEEKSAESSSSTVLNITEEKLQALLSSAVEKALNASFSSGRSRSRSPKRQCYICHDPDHYAPDCPKRNRNRSPSPVRRCYNCGDTNHLIRDCPKEKEETTAPKSVKFQENEERSSH